MQVFVPYSDALRVAKEMACDKRRYNKQIVECNQIIKAIKGETEAWKNHPICHQYKKYLEWLEWYRDLFVYYKEGGYNDKDTNLNFILLNSPRLPSFLFCQDYLNSHKRRLYQKSPELYPQFAKYNDEKDKSNWYCVPINFPIPKRKGVSILGKGLIDYNNLNYIFIKYG